MDVLKQMSDANTCLQLQRCSVSSRPPTSRTQWNQWKLSSTPCQPERSGRKSAAVALRETQVESDYLRLPPHPPPPAFFFSFNISENEPEATSAHIRRRKSAAIVKLWEESAALKGHGFNRKGMESFHKANIVQQASERAQSHCWGGEAEGGPSSVDCG